MSDEQRASASQAADSTLSESWEEDGTVELSVDDIEPVESSETSPDTTQVIHRDRIEAQAAVDSEAGEQSIRTTMQNKAVNEETTNFDVPAELMQKVQDDPPDENIDPETANMRSFNTRPMLDVDADATRERSIPVAEADPDGFRTFVAMPDADGRVQLPQEVLKKVEGAEGSQVIIKVKVSKMS